MSGFKAGLKLGSGDSKPVSLPGMTCNPLWPGVKGDSENPTQKPTKRKTKPKSQTTKKLSEYVLNRDDINSIDQMCDRHSISKSTCVCYNLFGYFFGGYSLDQAREHLDSTSRTKEKSNRLDTLFYNVRANKHLIKVICANLTALLLAFDSDKSDQKSLELFKKIMATVFLYRIYTNEDLNGKLGGQADNIYQAGGNDYSHNRDRMEYELEYLHSFWSGDGKYNSSYDEIQREVGGLG